MRTNDLSRRNETAEEFAERSRKNNRKTWAVLFSFLIILCIGSIKDETPPPVYRRVTVVDLTALSADQLSERPVEDIIWVANQPGTYALSKAVIALQKREGLTELVGLLSHSKDEVRAAASTVLIEIAHKDAVQTASFLSPIFKDLSDDVQSRLKAIVPAQVAAKLEKSLR